MGHIGAMLLAVAVCAGAGEERPGKTMSIDCGGGVKMDLVWIPAGTFRMGSEDGRDEEKPVHAVRITSGFWMGKYEVTQAEYEAVRGTNPSHFKGSRRPVESVSWNDAAEFCRRLSRKARKTMGLPTKAEWEYACRAGTATGYNTGSTLSKSQAKFGSSDGTVNVGSYAPNAWGLCDVHGNVGEWCADWYGENSHGSWLASDPSAPPLGSLRVQCGGSWDLGAKFCRSAVHLWTQPDSEDDASGFRVVCVGVSP